MPFGERKGDEGESKFGEAEAEEHKHGGEAATSNTNSSGGMRARLELVNVDCGPTDCPVEERLELSMEFTLDRPLQHASWEIKFLVDSVHERHVVRLGATKPEDYPRGVSSMHFEVPRVSVSGIKPCTLANTALLVATLTCTDQGESAINEIATVNLVVQVADTGQGSLTRCIYSPLE